MKVTYDEADVLFVAYLDNEGNKILAAIACSDKAEKSLYQWQIHYLIKVGKEIGTLRTVFGLTFYAFDDQEQKALKDFVSEKGFKTYHGHI